LTHRDVVVHPHHVNVSAGWPIALAAAQSSIVWANLASTCGLGIPKPVAQLVEALFAGHQPFAT
jgi:hypothetical protein